MNILEIKSLKKHYGKHPSLVKIVDRRLLSKGGEPC
jgi:hypothetical protein